MFSTRSPETPGSQNQVPYTNPTSEIIVLQNIQATFQAKFADNYARSLADDYTFVADPADLSQMGNPAYFDNWTKIQEVNAFSNILKLGDAVHVTFSWPGMGQTLSTDKPDERYFKDQQYQMVLTKGLGRDTTFSGKADLYLREANGIWSIFKWVDKRDGSGNATLGLVRWKGTIQF